MTGENEIKVEMKSEGQEGMSGISRGSSIKNGKSVKRMQSESLAGNMKNDSECETAGNTEGH